jgi:hypothetical protein
MTQIIYVVYGMYCIYGQISWNHMCMHRYAHVHMHVGICPYTHTLPMWHMQTACTHKHAYTHHPCAHSMQELLIHTYTHATHVHVHTVCRNVHIPPMCMRTQHAQMYTHRFHPCACQRQTCRQTNKHKNITVF